jgi:hypothetical protein
MKLKIDLNQLINHLELYPNQDYFYRDVMFLNENKVEADPKFLLPKITK